MKVTHNTTLKITYPRVNVTQTFTVLTEEVSELVKENKLIHLSLPSEKLKKDFASTNKVKYEFNEVTPKSPLGLAIMGLAEGETGVMLLPITQGGEWDVIITKIL